MYIYIYIYAKFQMGSYFGHGFNLAPTQEFVKPPTHCCISGWKSPDPSLMEPDFLSLRGGPNVSIKKHSYWLLKSLCLWLKKSVESPNFNHFFSGMMIPDGLNHGFAGETTNQVFFFVWLCRENISTISLSEPIILLYPVLLLKKPLMAHFCIMEGLEWKILLK